MTLKKNALTRWLPSAMLGFVSALCFNLPSKAADNIFLTYGPVKLTVRVDSLQRFAEEGIVDANLRFYFNLARATPEQLQELRRILTTRAELDPLVVSRFLNTDIGEDILRRSGRILGIPWQINGQYALRGAIVSAGLDAQGLTLINFLRKLPTNGHVSGEILLQQGRIVEMVVRASEYGIQVMAQLSAEEAKQGPPVNFTTLPDPRQPGAYGPAIQQRWQLTDASRNRSFYVDVYKPQRWRNGKTPVIVFSHGLASRPEDFDLIAKHLASYGFVVAMPQHPGSDFLQAQALIEGTSREIFQLNEFIDRPKDLSYVIDELERRNAGEFQGRLNLTQVGVGGHSFGGYAALAVAGATIDWDFLKAECDLETSLPNTSLLLQCQALRLPQKDYAFKDPRVTAVAVGNPVNSAIFGIKGLRQVQAPVMIIGGTYDPATPFVFEQIRSFPRLGSTEKYLLLAEGQAHVDFSRLDPGAKEFLNSFTNLTLPPPDLLHAYTRAYATPFFEVYTAGNKTYRPFLQAGAAYSEYLSQDQQFKVFFISQKSEAGLLTAIQGFRERWSLPEVSGDNALLTQ
jgi:predicted dienelactone hydrolase